MTEIFARLCTFLRFTHYLVTASIMYARLLVKIMDSLKIKFSQLLLIIPVLFCSRLKDSKIPPLSNDFHTSNTVEVASSVETPEQSPSSSSPNGKQIINSPFLYSLFFLVVFVVFLCQTLL